MYIVNGLMISIKPAEVFDDYYPHMIELDYVAIFEMFTNDHPN